MPKRLIDANALYNDLKESVKAAREWREEAQDEEIKIRAEQAHGTFCECALRVKNAPTIEAEPVRHAHWESWGFVFHGIEWKRCSACNKCAGVSYYGLLDGKIEMETPARCGCCGAKMDEKFTLGSEANGCWISCAECANTGCKNRYVQEVQEDE